MKIALSMLLSSMCFALQSAPVPVAQIPEGYISPARAVPTGKAPGMKYQLVKNTSEEKIYAVVFYKGDEALSGLTDFALQTGSRDAHFTGIGAVSSATLAWLDLDKKLYRRIAVPQQVEALSITGDIADFGGKPIVHMHAVLGRSDGTTVGGHVFELNVNPTLEFFVTVNTVAAAQTPG